MKRNIIIAGAAGILSAVMVAWGQAVTAESAPFTFPADVGVIKTRGAITKAAYFGYSVPASRAGVVAFTWSFPAQPVNQHGSITVYSLLGRSVKTFPVAANEGRVSWDLSGQNVRGVYIARITCGTARQTIRFLLCR